MSDAQIIIAVKSDGSSVKVIKRDLDSLAQSGKAATGSAKQLEGQMKSTATAAQMLSRAMGAVFAVVGVREIMRMSDSMSVLQGRLDNATRSARESEIAFDGLRRVAMNTGSSLEAAVSVFQRLSFVRDEINATIGEMLQFTDTVSKLGVVSGASNEALRAGLTQLGQGLSSNILRAEEFNSIMENIPAVGKAIADQFGVTTGQLRQLVVEGEVLSEDIFTAVLRASEEANENFEKMPLTFARAAAVVGAAFQGIFVDIENTTGAANFLATVMLKVADIVSGLGKIFVGAANIAQAAFKTVVGSLYDLFTAFANFAFTTLNGIIDFANRLPGVDIAQIPLHDRNTFNRNLSADIAKDLSEASRAFSEAGGAFLGLESEKSLEHQEAAARELSKNYADIVKSLTGATEESKKAKKAQDALTKAIEASRTEEERLIDKIKELEGMRGIPKTAERAEKLEEAIRRANGELDEFRIKAERNGPVAKAFESLVNQIDDGFRDAFRNAFTGAENGWKGLIDGMKASFKTLLADLAYMAFARPIVAQIVGVAGGVMGVSSGAQASIIGDVMGTGGGGLFGGLGQIGQIGSSILNGGLFSSGLNAWGGQAGFKLGNMLGLGMDASGMLGDFVGGGLGSMGYGMIGSLGANLLGLGGGIGGTVGGALGSFVGGGIGSSMGTILGMAGGPVGAVVGSFLGSALGGLFGGKKPSGKYQYGNLDLATLAILESGGQTGDKFSQQNADGRDAIGQRIAAYTQLLQAAGGSLSGSIGYGISNKPYLGMGFGVGSQSPGAGTGFQWFQDEGKYFEALYKTLTDMATGLSDTYKTVLSKVGFSDVEKIAEAFSFAEYYESIVNPVDAVEAAIKGVNEQFDAMIKRADELGLTSAVFTEAMEKQRQVSLDLIKAQQAGFQSLEAMKATFDSWLYDQSLSSTSTLSPADKLMAARGNFGDLLSKAQGGDYSVTQQLLQAGQQLLTIGQGMYASSVDFAVLEHFVRQSISQIARDLDIPGYASGTRSARRGKAWVGEEGPEIVDFGGGERVYTARESARMQADGEARMVAMEENNTAMRESMERMEKAINRMVNKAVAG